ncbi:hypothetical protein NBZ79_09290 [Sneathiella marina]|uniref:Uncharacterized protein n=1 Tax=Sneathiella marina TaxID=2950108 RepID=A0ABY4WD29_9PROT|nr:hypothetical protein [Sneathiella marina]USG63169.1 hypothetical protein NBZ79_09290 [Sneathiella marina]
MPSTIDISEFKNQYPFLYHFILFHYTEIFNELCTDYQPVKLSGDFFRDWAGNVKNYKRALNSNMSLAIGRGLFEKLYNTIDEKNIKTLNSTIAELWKSHHYATHPNLTEDLGFAALAADTFKDKPSRNQYKTFCLSVVDENLRGPGMTGKYPLAKICKGILNDTSVGARLGRTRYSLAQTLSFLSGNPENTYLSMAGVTPQVLVIVFIVFFALSMAVFFVFGLGKSVIEKNIKMALMTSGLFLPFLLGCGMMTLVFFTDYDKKIKNPSHKNVKALKTFTDGVLARHKDVIDGKTFDVLFSIAHHVNDIAESIGLGYGEMVAVEGKKEELYPFALNVILEFMLPQMDYASWKTYGPLLKEIMTEAEKQKLKSGDAGLFERLRNRTSSLDIVTRYWRGQTDIRLDTTDLTDVPDHKETAPESQEDLRIVIATPEDPDLDEKGDEPDGDLDELIETDPTTKKNQ